MSIGFLSLYLFSVIFKLLLVSRHLIFLLFTDALSLQSVIWSLMITASSGMSLCASVFLYITLALFVFVSYVCRPAVVPELTGQKTTPISPKAGQTRAALLAPRAPFLHATLSTSSSLSSVSSSPHRVKQPESSSATEPT